MTSVVPLLTQKNITSVMTVGTGCLMKPMNEPKKYFLSFIEECIMNEKYSGYVGGRIEVYDNESENPYNIEEIRFFTNKCDKFYAFREAWDFQDVTELQLNMIRNTATKAFLNYPKEDK